MDRRFLARPDRQRLRNLSQSWRLRATGKKEREPALLIENARALDSAIHAADEAELQARRFERAELLLADVHRTLVRAARRRKSLTKREMQGLAEQIDATHDVLKPPS